MICGYDNIYDLCTNKFNYQYSSFVDNGRHVLAASGSLDPVIRIDKNTGQRFLLTSTDLINIDDCDNTQDLQTISAWECYQTYRSANLPIQLPSLADYKNAQKQYILDKYNNLLENGINITINNFVVSSVLLNSSGSGSGSGNTTSSVTKVFSIRLPATKNDQIYYTNLASFINLWYITNSESSIPRIIDYYNRSHELSYINLNRILTAYFLKLKEYLDIKNDLLDIIDKAQTLNDVYSAVFYTSRQVSGSASRTTIS